MSYDTNNIFARILRGEIPAKKIYEDDWAFAFHDIHPQAPVHALVIPKGPYTCWRDFAERGSDAEVAGFFRAVQTVAKTLGVSETGYRTIANAGPDSMQEVPHFHVHILAGARLGTKIVTPLAD
ncbi:histidine triad nucleotide-binding protein [Phaeovibrio sulfidiphilus]|uniref:Histidine triad nucleotide-binding protein n=1 Tax=Phaeovibrio sulfidiphilus TaxID=1220600 RepID=A0A8J7CD22_9PROT|nr:histidine triad nucleotide-binding protein [Phaeovibrio sulfidiphilus]MBE1236574.1 histidine triad nucleotide-binding protein [Phaeovibrio sulfidiphilus]